MKSVTLQIDNDPRSPMVLAQEIATWLGKQGLRFLQDYEWANTTVNHRRVFIVNFADHCEEMSTLFALAWVK